MVFNIFIGNTDDHAKNHATFWDGRWLQLTPAYDLVAIPRVGQEAAQAMDVGAFGRSSTIANALSEAGRFGLKTQRAIDTVDAVESKIVDRWKIEFQNCGVSPNEIDRLNSATILSPAGRRRMQ